MSILHAKFRYIADFAILYNIWKTLHYDMIDIWSKNFVPQTLKY